MADRGLRTPDGPLRAAERREEEEVRLRRENECEIFDVRVGAAAVRATKG